jgi:hypothetical protein
VEISCILGKAVANETRQRLSNVIRKQPIRVMQKLSIVWDSWLRVVSMTDQLTLRVP